MGIEMDNKGVPPPPPPARRTRKTRKTAEEIIGIPYARRCADCPSDITAVCKRMFGKYWAGKSDDGRGCMQPVDDICAMWRGQ